MATYYVSQAGSGAADGSTVSDAMAIATFNATASGGAGGNTYYFLGTITTGVNCPSGSAGNVITVRGDYTGTPGYIIVSSGSAWKCTGGARSYYQIKNLYLETTASDDAIFTNGSSYVIDGCTIKSALTCIEISNARSADSITITNNTMIPGTSAAADCILWVAANAAYDLTNLTITGNTISGAGRYGIDIGNTDVDNCTVWTITNNTITACTNAGLRLNTSATSNRVTKVTVTGNTIQGCTGGMAIYNIEGIISNNNSSYNTGVTGGLNLFASDLVTISHNVCSYNETTGVDGCGILIDNDNSNITVRSNECSYNEGSASDNSGAAIMVLGVNTITVFGNKGIGNKHGLWLAGAAGVLTGVTAYHNAFADCADDGVVISSTVAANRITLQGNIFTGSGSYGVDDDGDAQAHTYNCFYGLGAAYHNLVADATETTDNPGLGASLQVSASTMKAACPWVANVVAYDDLPLPLHPDFGAVQDRNAEGRRFGVSSGTL